MFIISRVVLGGRILGRNPSLMERCQPLREYAWTVEAIRENMKTMEVSQAVSDALERMPENSVI